MQAFHGDLKTCFLAVDFFGCMSVRVPETIILMVFRMLECSTGHGKVVSRYQQGGMVKKACFEQIACVLLIVLCLHVTKDASKECCDNVSN